MKLKKANALLGLLSIVFLIIHMGYSSFAYMTFYYNPFLKLITAIPFIILVCLHAILGMLTVFTHADGGRMDLYPGLNHKTILQRVSAALIFPLLILHLNTFSLMEACAQNGYLIFFWLLILGELLFYACTLTHVVLSLTRGLITLGLITSQKTQKVIDQILYILAAVAFCVCSYLIVEGQVVMFLMA